MVGYIKNLKVKTKLVLGFSVVSILFLAAILVTFINVKDTQTRYDNLTNVNQEILLKITKTDMTITKMTLNIRGYLLYKDEKYYNDYLKLKEDFNGELRALENLLEDDGQKADFTLLRSLESEYYVFVQEAVQKGRNKDFDSAAQLAVSKGRGIGEGFRNEIDRLTKDQKDIIKKEVEANSEKVNETLLVLVVLSVVAAALAVISAGVISHFILSPINELKSVMQKVADGDLRAKSVYSSRDDLGVMTESFNVMVESLRDIIVKINQSSVGLLSSTQQISASTEQIASGSEEQANAAQAINSLTNEMAAAIEEVAKSAEQAAIYSQQAVEVAKKGGDFVDNSIKGMEAINSKISELEINSQQIGEIVDVIDDVAEQTNLLALNAAIEAARAGDAGKGFAVVADEVRKLAERSSEATKDIAQLIKNIQKNTNDTVKVVSEGTSLTKQVGAAFGEIVKSIDVTAGKVNEIAAASEEQAAQAGEVVNAVQNVASVTEEASAGAQETAATSQEIAGMAEDLAKTVSKFRV